VDVQARIEVGWECEWKDESAVVGDDSSLPLRETKTRLGGYRRGGLGFPLPLGERIQVRGKFVFLSPWYVPYGSYLGEEGVVARFIEPG
jgi:hypothetical protein